MKPNEIFALATVFVLMLVYGFILGHFVMKYW